MIQAERCKSFMETQLLLLPWIQPHRTSSCTCTSLKQTSFLPAPLPQSRILELLRGLLLHWEFKKQQDPLDIFNKHSQLQRVTAAAPQPEHSPCCVSVFTEHPMLRHWGCSAAGTGGAAPLASPDPSQELRCWGLSCEQNEVLSLLPRLFTDHFYLQYHHTLQCNIQRDNLFLRICNYSTVISLPAQSRQVGIVFSFIFFIMF